MKTLFFLLLTLTPFTSSAMEVVINCTNLAGGGACRIHNGQGRFLSINKKSILSYESTTNCSFNECDYLGKAEPHYLKVGSNQIDFSIATRTSDAGLYVHHLYKFFFAGHYKAKFNSKRTGSNLDQTHFGINLDLQEIDPALYRDYLRARAALTNVDQREELDLRWKEWRKELSDIEGELRELAAGITMLSGLDLADITPALVERLGITKNQFLLLTARQDELQQFIRDGQIDAKREEAEAIARYQSVRARARKYQADLPDTPLAPRRSTDSSLSISPVVESMVNDLNVTLSSFEKALREEDVKSLRTYLKKWKTLSDYVTESYLTVDQNEFNNAEKNLLYRTVSDGTRTIFKNGFTSDLWLNTNELSLKDRETIDELSPRFMEAEDLRQTLYFKKIPEALKGEVHETLQQASALNEKIKLLEDKNEKEVSVKKIAEASLRVALSNLDESIKNGDKEALSEAQDSLSLGLQVIDVALSVTPVVSSARDVYELFTGKNMVTGEKFETIDYSLAFIGVFSGLVGGNLAKIAFERSSGLVKKIAARTGLVKVPDLSLQVENLVLHARKWFYRKAIMRAGTVVNNILKKKYPRFTEDPFVANSKVIHRFSATGEEYCRVFSKYKIPTVGKRDNNKVSDQGGIFVFRCADALHKSLTDIMKLFAIPAPKYEAHFFITKFKLPSGVSLFEGAANPLFDKPGQGMQIFIDSNSASLLQSFRETHDQLIEGVFRGI